MHLSSRSITLLAFAFLLGTLVGVAPGCKTDNPAYDPDPSAGGTGSGSGEDILTQAVCGDTAPASQEFPGLAAPDKLDVLVVISNAPGTAALQQRLSRAMPALVEGLTQAGIDAHIGVTTGDASNLDAFGSLRSGVGDGCDDAPRFFATAQAGGDAARFASCNVLQGSSGPAQQQPLRAAERALTLLASDPDPALGNAGFVRPDARLLVLVASDRDDCSSDAPLSIDDAPNTPTGCAWSSATLSDIDATASALFGLKADLSATSVALITGSELDATPARPEPLDIACADGQMNPVYPAARLLTFADRFAPNALFEPACSASFSGTMRRVLERIVAAPATTVCLPTPTDDAILSVTSGAGDAIAPGQDGYLYLGPTDACANGALQINANALTGDARSVNVTWCPSG